METRTFQSDNTSTLEIALAQLCEIVEDGLHHGHFEYGATCEVTNGKKRRLVIKAGKNYQYTITEDELRGS